MLLLRPARSADVDLLAELLLAAVHWRPDDVAPPVAALWASPELTPYVEGFGRPGDFGVVALIGDQRVGAAWCRRFPADRPGYGYVDDTTPELSIAVRDGHRGTGIGTTLLQALFADARHRDAHALSLSVIAANPAAALYRRLGFEEVGTHGAAITMRLDLDAAAPGTGPPPSAGPPAPDG